MGRHLPALQTAIEALEIIEPPYLFKRPRKGKTQSESLFFSRILRSHEGATESKITALVLGWAEDSMVRSDSRASELPSIFEVGVASIVGDRGPRSRNGLPGARSARSGDTVDGQWPR